jgi:serine/threonine protein kinase
MVQDELIGKTLGQYQILEELGRGGMAVVYKAWQTALQRYVAIKVLQPHLVSDTEFIQRFQQEAIVAANLKNSHIVTIYEVGQEGGYIFIAMEYVKGTSLEEIISKEGTLPLDRTLHILRQVAEALDYAHQQHFVHRDVKPANILVEPGDNVVITDFGIAKALEGSGATAKLTVAGSVMGTPAYMSPEQIQGLSIDYRTDLYSLGIVAYQMLGGEVPFGGNTTAVLYAQVNNPLPSIARLNSTIPPYVERALQQMLVKKPSDRFVNAAAFVEALSGVGMKPGPLPKGETALLPESIEVPPYAGPAASPPSVYPSPPPPSVLPNGPTQVAPPVYRSPQKRSGSGLWWLLLGGGVLFVLLLAFVAGVVLRPWRWLNKETPVAEVVATETATEEPTVTEEPTATAEATEVVVAAPLDKIVFTSERDGNAEIYIMNSDGSEQRNLTNSPENEYYPRWSPDGTKISCFVAPVGVGVSEEQSELCLIDISAEEMIVIETGLNNARFADWSPDGQELVFSGKQDQGWKLYVFSLDTGITRQITTGKEPDSYPSWSPDAKYIAFARSSGEDREIYKMSTNGEEIYNLSNSPGADWLPSWSPSGRQLLFTRQQGDERGIYIMDADGKGLRQLANAPGAIDSQPRWNFSGDQFVFWSDRDGNQEIYRMSVDGTNLIRLTDNPLDDFYPDW